MHTVTSTATNMVKKLRLLTKLCKFQNISYFSIDFSIYFSILLVINDVYKLGV